MVRTGKRQRQTTKKWRYYLESISTYRKNMTTIRPNTRADGIPTHRLAFYTSSFIALVIAGSFLFSSPSSSSSSSHGSGQDVGGDGELLSPATLLKTMNRVPPSTKVAAADGDGGSDERIKTKEELDEIDVDPLRVVLGSVTYAHGNDVDGDGGGTLPYYHCGPPPSRDDEGLTELILLHGAAFTKEDWAKSGILDLLCEINNEEDEGDLSILALDLPVKSDGAMLRHAFDALVDGGMLTGRPVTFVTPSASGYSIVNLGETAMADGGELTKMVKAWIPVASPAVLKATDATLTRFKNANIPILSIHGDGDEMGKKVTKRLETISGAEGVELTGGHPVYLDSPQEFVGRVMEFLDEKGL